MKNFRWLFWLFVIAFVWLIVSRFTEIERLALTLIEGKWQWVLVAAILQIISYMAMALLYKNAFASVGVNSHIHELIPLTFTALFVSVAVPAGGTGGPALFVEDARRRGESPARATAGTLLVLIAQFGSFLVVLAAGMIYLFIRKDLQVYQVITAILMLLLVLGQSSILMLGLWWPEILIKILFWVQRLANKFGILIKKQPLLRKNWAQDTSAEFIDASIAITNHPDQLLKTFGVGLTIHLVNILSLLSVFMAFYSAPGAGILVAGYAMCFLFAVVSITPQGIGIVEGVMSLVFTSLAIPSEESTIISLAFRGLTFWVPLLIGFFLLRRLRLFQKKEEQETIEKISL